MDHITRSYSRTVWSFFGDSFVVRGLDEPSLDIDQCAPPHVYKRTLHESLLDSRVSGMELRPLIGYLRLALDTQRPHTHPTNDAQSTKNPLHLITLATNCTVCI